MLPYDAVRIDNKEMNRLQGQRDEYYFDGKDIFDWFDQVLNASMHIKIRNGYIIHSC